MVLNSIEEITDLLREEFYDSSGDGICIIRDKELLHNVRGISEYLKKKEFSLKEYQHINNGQMEYVFTQKECATVLQEVLSLDTKIREKLRVPSSTTLTCSATLYPVSGAGSSLHQDFSYNKYCTNTFFFGETEFVTACSRDGAGMKRYDIKEGDIVVMRAPQDGSEEEKKKRPIHAIGVVKQPLYAIEVRDVCL